MKVISFFKMPAERGGGHSPGLAFRFLPAYLAALIVLLIVRPRPDIPPYLLTVADTIFLVAAPAIVATIALLSFLAGGFLPILLLGAGVLSQSMACLTTIVMREPSPTAPTNALIFGGGLWLAGYFHLATVIACMGGGVTVMTRARRWLAVGIVAVSLGTVLVLAALLFRDSAPLSFFGLFVNPVAVRFMIVTSALPFAAAAIGAWSQRNRTSRIFLGWYALVLMTVAMGRATELLSRGPDDSLYMLARVAYYSAGILMLIAVLQTAFYRFVGVAVSRTMTRYLHDSGISYQSLVEISTEAIVAMEPDGSVRYWNPAAERLLWPGARHVAFDFADQAASPEVAGELRASLASLLSPEGEAARAARLETTLRGADGREFPAELSLLARRSDLGIAVALVEDISDRKATEHALKEAAATIRTRARLLQELTLELTEAEQRERRRLAVLLHDHLQQLLVAAKLNLAHFLQKRGDDPPPLVNLAIEQLAQAVEASRSLAVEISPPVLERGGLGPALYWLREVKQKKYGLIVDVEIAAELEPEPPIRDLLFQAVRELLFNVVKHAGTDRAWIRVTAAGDSAVSVEVRDDGSGCDPDTILKKQPGQTGFGLFSISQRLEAVGGKFVVECPDQGGTSILMTAPLRRESSVTRAASAPPAPATPGPARRPLPEVHEKRGALRILVADDHEILRQGLITVLDDQPDFQVVGQAATALETIAVATQLRPDIVVLDVSLERPLSGVQAARDLVSLVTGVLVVGLTMHDDPAIHRAMRAAGAYACITKGGACEILLQTLRAAASSRPDRARSAEAGRSFPPAVPTENPIRT